MKDKYTKEGTVLNILHDIKMGFKGIKFDASLVPEMEILERELYSALSDSKGPVREMCSHILAAGGKRLRPLLVLYSGLIFSEISEELVNAAISAELIHAASLVHDDIIDDSPLRRGRPSVSTVWGNQFAVLCGDYLYARACGMLSRNRLVKSLEYMTEAIENMCSGEILQAGDRFNRSINLDTYYQRIAQKTAILLKCCCQSGAVVAGASEIYTEMIGEYGYNVGMAFQIIDDILDFCGSEEAMGKPECGDLKQGNITLPMILLLNDERYGEWVGDVIDKREFSSEIISEVRNALVQSGKITESFEIAQNHVDKARQSLRLLPQTRYTAFLDKLAVMLQVRVN